MSDLIRPIGQATPTIEECEKDLAYWQNKALDFAVNKDDLKKQINQLEKLISGLKHNISVAYSELKQVHEKEVSKSAWDHIDLAIEFTEPPEQVK